MPGVFGGLGGSSAEFERLALNFGHGGQQPLAESHDRFAIAVDGERSLYAATPTLARDLSEYVGRTGLSAFCEIPPVKVNLVVADRAERRILLCSEATGTYPLYYTFDGRRLLFSSLLRVLAAALDAPPDVLGLLEFQRNGYTVGSRTHFAGIARLQPGERVLFDLSRRVLERAQALTHWTRPPPSEPTARVPDVLWSTLGDATQRCIDPGAQHALMISAGWDSRLLLAALQQTEPRIRLGGYVHGDLEGRELRLVARLCELSGLPLRSEPLSDSLCELKALDRGFRRTENVVFPHWHRAGRVLAEQGVEVVLAGIYGEVLGGHYGAAMLLSGFPQMRAVATPLLRGSLSRSLGTGARLLGGTARDLLLRFPLRRPWYVSPVFWADHPGLVEGQRGDLEQDLDRLAGLGIRDDESLIEAFVSTHRGTQYINAQLLSCRGYTDIAAPYLDEELLSLASAVPLSQKIHNALSRTMLSRHEPQLLSVPCAATLVAASAPILLQEASRALRKTYEHIYHRASRIVPGLRPLRLGWVNFDFLRNGRALTAIVEDLRAPMWDRGVLLQTIREAGQPRSDVAIHPLSDQITKIYTSDLMIRTPS